MQMQAITLRPAGPGAMVQTGRHQWSNSPTYARKLAGIRERQEYAAAAGEAGALSRVAPATRDLGFAQAQGIRQAAIAQARQQTMDHFKVRSDMADSLEQASALRDQRVMALAELALKGEMHRADQVLAERGLALDEQRVGAGIEHDEKALALNEQEMQMRGSEGAADRALKEREMKEAREERVGENMGRALDRKAEHESMRRRELADLNQAYTPDSVAKYSQSNDPADLVARESKSTRARKILPGYAFNRAKSYGYDTSVFDEFDEDTEKFTGKRSQTFHDFRDMVQQIQDDYPELPEDQVFSEAAAAVGVPLLAEDGSRGEDVGTRVRQTGAGPQPDVVGNKWRGGAGKPSGDHGDPPVAGAEWSEKHGAWVATDPATGKKYIFEG